MFDNYIFRENSRKLRSHFLVIFRENMVHNKIKHRLGYFVRHSTDRLLNVFLIKILH